ncbi:hypothetical protein WOSG25_051240 [Weissella oryzae SG25]|uniref:Uncharacterized protein n=1 Tax=Weissella oryzae (strain DSM 25784 / JCM 18191 / LMG 30913 / SG25) TaxID=1329250 RepID=A0A069CU02_WEIOS|nr:InlB B-repeat-containing protein [Weissella oryzae]GAK30852.1 hypothetical protein WOSG25_051240 [Weissella oryzae SG25]
MREIKSYRMYKNGKKWVYAMGLITFVAGNLATSGLLMMNNSVVKADESQLNARINENLLAAPGDSLSSLENGQDNVTSGSEMIEAESINNDSMAEDEVTATIDVQVSNLTALVSAIAAAPTDGTSYTIEIDGTLTGTANISVPSGTNITLTGGQIVGSGTAIGQGVVSFNLNGNANFTVNDVFIDDSVNAPQGVFTGNAGGTATLKLTGSTTLKGTWTAGGPSDDFHYAIIAMGISQVQIQDNATITNWAQAYIPSGLATAANHRLVMLGNASFQDCYYGIYSAAADAPTVYIYMYDNASFKNNTIGILSLNPINLTGGTFSGHTAAAIECLQAQGTNTGTTRIARATFSNNSAKYGSVLAYLGANTLMSIGSCTFENNQAQFPGGVFMMKQGTLEISNSQFTNNSSTQNGGALGVDIGSTKTTLNNCTFSNNTAANGGAIGFYNNQVPVDNTAANNANAYLSKVNIPAVSRVGTSFTNNSASTLMELAPADQALANSPNVAGVTATSALTSPYNNYDIQYYGDTVTAARVSFNSNGGSVVPDFNGYIGEIIKEPAVPVRAGYTFAGWFSDSDLTNAWDFVNDQIPNSLIDGTFWLYAKWIADDITPGPGDTNGSGNLVVEDNQSTEELDESKLNELIQITNVTGQSQPMTQLANNVLPKADFQDIGLLELLGLAGIVASGLFYQTIKQRKEKP